MRAPLTAAQHTVGEPGRFVAAKHLEKHFSVVGSGMPSLYIIVGNAVLIVTRRYSVLPALALEHGIIHCEIVEGAFDTDMFYTFISRLLDEMNPFPGPNSVIIMDNCRIHKHPAIMELIESR